jgi:hypothetical protein
MICPRWVFLRKPIRPDRSGENVSGVDGHPRECEASRGARQMRLHPWPAGHVRTGHQRNLRGTDGSNPSPSSGESYVRTCVRLARDRTNRLGWLLILLGSPVTRPIWTSQASERSPPMASSSSWNLACRRGSRTSDHLRAFWEISTWIAVIPSGAGTGQKCSPFRSCLDRRPSPCGATLS